MQVLKVGLGLAQHWSHIYDAPFPTIHRMMLTRKQGRKIKTISPQVKKKVPPSRLLSLWEKQEFVMFHPSTALAFRNINALQARYMGMAWVVLPSFSTPVPELGRISAPRDTFPKGLGAPSPGEGAVELVPCCCSEQQQQEQRGDGAAFVKINKFKEKALNVFPQQL